MAGFHLFIFASVTRRCFYPSTLNRSDNSFFFFVLFFFLPGKRHNGSLRQIINGKSTTKIQRWKRSRFLYESYWVCFLNIFMQQTSFCQLANMAFGTEISFTEKTISFLPLGHLRLAFNHTLSPYRRQKQHEKMLPLFSASLSTSLLLLQPFGFRNKGATSRERICYWGLSQSTAPLAQLNLADSHTSGLLASLNWIQLCLHKEAGEQRVGG